MFSCRLDRQYSLGYLSHFAESICTDQKIVEDNIRSVKISSPDVSMTDACELMHCIDVYSTSNSINCGTLKRPLMIFRAGSKTMKVGFECSVDYYYIRY